jgi:hypothetical protein
VWREGRRELHDVELEREALVLVDVVMRFGSESVKLYH